MTVTNYLTVEAKHRAGLGAAQALPYRQEEGWVIGNGHPVCRARCILDFIYILSKHPDNSK